jgi:hypothetical protein
MPAFQVFSFSARVEPPKPPLRSFPMRFNEFRAIFGRREMRPWGQGENLKF